jgi:hypothetical protein
MQMRIEHFAKATKKKIWCILRAERTRRNHQLVRSILRQDTATIGLARVDIPDSAVPVNPKEWTGAWKSVTNPDAIGTALCAVNTQQYHQADITPFGYKPLRSYFGLHAEAAGATQFLQNGEVPPEISNQLMTIVSILPPARNRPHEQKCRHVAAVVPILPPLASQTTQLVRRTEIVRSHPTIRRLHVYANPKIGSVMCGVPTLAIGVLLKR